VTDALDQLAPAARPLLHRVDTALAESGAPADDPVWPLLRRVRAAPSEAVAAVAGWRAAPLEAVADPLRALARRYGEALDGLPAQPPWEGAGAVAYGVQWSVLRGHVTGAGPDSMVGRLRESAAYADEVADWVRRSRRAVAVALADVLGSAEAVTLVTALGSAALPAAVAGIPAAGTPAAGTPAAARIAAHLLEPVAAACDEGRRLHDEWRAKLGEVPLSRPSAGGAPDGAPTGIPVLRIND
jgi:hypothetical protein